MSSKLLSDSVIKREQQRWYNFNGLQDIYYTTHKVDMKNVRRGSRIRARITSNIRDFHLHANTSKSEV